MFKTKLQKATAIAILFHIIGFIGLIVNKNFIVATTPLNLMLMFFLLIYTHPKINLQSIFFIVLCFAVGLWVEIIGTSTGILFGQYEYGKSLGPTIKNVPLMIGINWYIIMYCCGCTVYIILQKLSAKVKELTGSETSSALQVFSIMSDAAMMAVFFDWVMEPAAIKLGYWQWLGDGEIPTYNYLSWFMVSSILLLVFGVLKFDKQNQFAVHLLMIMSMFFLLVQTFLK
jgi:bisanhydrobacterioruberin hydratase